MLQRYWAVTKHTYFAYRDDGCSKMAAAIAYYVLFSTVPLLIFTVSIFGFVLQSSDVRGRVVDQILEIVPLSETEGRSAVETALSNVRQVSGIVAVLGLLATLWTSSAMFGAIRWSLNAVWKVRESRPFVQGKLVDLMQVGGLMFLLLASIVLTGLLQAVRALSAEEFGPLAGHSPLWNIPPVVLPALLSFAAFFALYRVVPAAHPAWHNVLPGAALATVLFEVLKDTFAIYVANFNNFDVVYGALAGVLLFLLYTFLASNIVLIGAEVAHAVERLRAGDFASEFDGGAPSTPIGRRALRAVKGLFVRQP